MITVITGPMFASKSKRLIQYLTGAMVRDIPCLALKPQQDDRTSSASIYSYDGSAFPAAEIPSRDEVGALQRLSLPASGKTHMLAVDEVQFMGDEAIRYLEGEYLDSPSWLILSGLSQDSDGKPFGPLAEMKNGYAGIHLERLTARCSFCHGVATMTHCKVEKDGPVLTGRDIYEPRCFPCWQFGLEEKR